MAKDTNKTKRILAWIILSILTGCLLTLTYIKFFGYPNQHIEERPINSSSEKAIRKALENIVKNFNDSEEVKEYANQNIKMQATLNQHSIFISHITESTTTYEFSYSNLILSITIDKNEENIKKFNQVYSTLLKAIQKRINNNEDNIDEIISSITNENKTYDGITKEETNDTITYRIDITKKPTLITIESSEDSNSEINIQKDEENIVDNNTEKE